MSPPKLQKHVVYCFLYFSACILIYSCRNTPAQADKIKVNDSLRECISLNEGWHFFKYHSANNADNLIYDIRPEINAFKDNRPADLKPSDAVEMVGRNNVLKPYILPCGNDFIADPAKRHVHPGGDPGGDFPFVLADFDDSSWEVVDLPHDWAIKGPFQKGWDAEVGGGMGRLPVNGVAWYRKRLDIPESDRGRCIYLDIDGAMSYAIVWLNGHLVGGWPYGYASWRLDLTPYVVYGGINQLAIRLDNPNYSARWYPGAGLYRNVWLTKTDPVHVGQYGTYITARNITKDFSTLDIEVTIENCSEADASVEVRTLVYALDGANEQRGTAVAGFPSSKTVVTAGGKSKTKVTTEIKKPKLWGPPPTQNPYLYVAETTVFRDGAPVDSYSTRFGIRKVEFDPDKGISVNGEQIKIRGVCNHHDLGALGAAFNTRAAERQLEILQEMGCNAIRTAHNPPAPELLELTDKMGFLVMDEIFDSWELKKTPYDFHLIFPDWAEPDTRAFIRRDRNCPSVIMWSLGNEVGEQYTAQEGASVAKRLYDYVKEEDPDRPTVTAMNFAKPNMELPAVTDIIGLNYQGEGIRQDPVFEGTDRIRTAPSYDAFHEEFPEKVILGTETASAMSSRGVYLFPVTEAISSPIRDSLGGDTGICQVSSYELYAVDFGSSTDKVFAALDSHPFVAGEFVWTGWDYLGEPTPYYEARSSYTGIIDLAGFKKDRFYLYQSHWRPEMPVAHILPHWTWPERFGKVTPVHVFTSGDEAELFLNGKSLGRRQKRLYEYRLRWDSVVYEPGTLKVITYKDGKKWADETVETAGNPARLSASIDRKVISADGKDLSFVTVQVTDRKGNIVPYANNLIEFSVEGPGEIIATDNGNPMDMNPFISKNRNAFSGIALAIIRSSSGEKGKITVKVNSAGLKFTSVEINAR